MTNQPNKHGEGVAALFKDGLGVKLTHSTKNNVLTYSEHTDCSVITGRDQMRWCVIYHPTPSRYNNGFNITQFCYEWSTYLDQLATLPQEIILTGEIIISIFMNLVMPAFVS